MVKNPKKVFFRTDSSHTIGSGHIVRCLTLAKALREKNIISSFICRDHNNNLIKKILDEKFDVYILKEKNKKKYTSLSKIDWLKDANQTINILKKEDIEWLIVDHYELDFRWEKKLRPYTKKIMVIDDLSNRKHECDILLDQNLKHNYKNKYKNLLPKYCSKFLGTQYTLLQSEYENLHFDAPIRTGPIKRIFLYFGNTNQKDLIELFVSAFLKLNRKDITLDIVIPLNYQSTKIDKLKKNHKNIKIYKDLKSLSTLMLKADLGIGACGINTWERCCLGLPSLVVTIADNQKLIAKELHKRGIIQWLGHKDKITFQIILDSLLNTIDRNIKNWSKSCKQVTDGKGIKKISTILNLSSKTKLKIRRAKIYDKDILFNWANDPLVRKSAFNSQLISVKSHNTWFDFRINKKHNCEIFILETINNVPIGQVRFEKKNRFWYVSYSLANFARGKNLSSKLLRLGIYEFKKKNNVNLFAEVKKTNIPSCRAFEKICLKKNSLYKYDFDIFRYKI